MTLLYAAYIILTGLLFLFLSPYLLLYLGATGRWGDHLRERLGFVGRVKRRMPAGLPRIWIHAVSLGEVRVAASIVEILKRRMPECSVIVSTTTPHGRESAQKQFGPDIPVIYAPIDLAFCVQKALRAIRPDVMVFLETEIWPAWLFEARRMGIKTALINGRISVRSIDAYRRLRPFMRQVLARVDAFSMILEEDARRLITMGAPPKRVEINGNAKYDGLASAANPGVEPEMRRLLNLKPGDKTIVAGSTRRGEEAMILQAYVDICKSLPDMVLIIAPRHVERAAGICEMVRQHGLTCVLRTRIPDREAEGPPRVVVMDTFGELFNIYSVATIAFCGASLVPLGGQNPLEPAAWGKAIVYGPSMEDFQDATAILEAADAGIRVSGVEELTKRVLGLLSNLEALTALGMRARDAVRKHQGASVQQAKVIQRLAGQEVRHPPQAWETSNPLKKERR
ncbi:MAG: 3-deoxy-D-manno-octulosonic acid transferase [Deltaproteobacteria bacterium]|nr:3-deoxy-D-manno-octulosonic acid transferase [Deltaproteobacteria bacterium]